MAGSLKQRILNAFDNLTTLEIVTAVGHAIRRQDAEGAGGLDLDFDRDPKIILTKINLLQGDIKTVYHEAFVTGEYADLKAFHAEREREGYALVRQNIETLERLLKLANDHLEG
jgi:hypothetical protein